MVVGFLSGVDAIVGSIGSAKINLNYLDPKVGDIFERTIKVDNRNDVPVDIEVSASGDLEGGIEILDNNFRLEARETRDVDFIIKVVKAGVTETKINVKFTPVGGGNGVGLSSTIFMDAEEGPGFLEGIFGGDDDDGDESGTDADDGDSTGDSKGSLGMMEIGLLVTAFVFLVFVVLLVVASRKGLGVKKGDEVKGGRVKGDKNGNGVKGDKVKLKKGSKKK